MKKYREIFTIFPFFPCQKGEIFIVLAKIPVLLHPTSTHKILCVELNYWHPRELGLLPDPEKI
jgi:hypothetical protein